MVGGDAALLVGRAGQGDVAFRPGHKVAHLHRVAHGVDVGAAGVHVLIHRDGTLDAQGQPGAPGQLRLGHHPDAQQHQVGGDTLPALQGDGQAVPLRHKAGDVGAQAELHPAAPEIGVHLRRHIGVQGGQHLVPLLEQGDGHPGVEQVLRRLQADEAAAHHHGPADRVGIQILPDAEGILHSAQGEHPGIVLPGQAGLDGPGAGGEDQLVVTLGIGAAVGQTAHLHRVLRRVDFQGLVAHPHVDAEPAAEALRGLEGQLIPVGDHPAHEVGQAAVGVGHIAGALQDDDLRPLVQAAQAGRGGGPAGHAADDDNLHIRFLLMLPAARGSPSGRPDR